MREQLPPFVVRDISEETHPTQYEERQLPVKATIVHTSGGRNSVPWLQRYEPNPRKRSSADAIILPDGTILILTPFGSYSYHCGPGLTLIGGVLFSHINEETYGLEIEVPHDSKTLCTREQHISAALYHRNKASVHGYSLVHAYGHQQVALPMNRKPDPQGFSWGQFFYYVYNPNSEMLAWEKTNR